MTAESRLFAKFTLDYADSHKIAPLSDAAFRAHIRMILWSRRMLTDGRIPLAMAKVFCTPRVLSELTGNDPVSPSLTLVGEDYWLHDFTEHQSSRAEVEATTKRNRANGRKGGLAKAKQVASKSLSETPSEIYPETETETETEKEKDMSSDAEPKEPYSAAFSAWYQHYPRKESKGDAFKAWEVLRRNRQLPTNSVLITAADNYARTQESQFWKLPGGWLRDRKWEDEKVTAKDSWGGKEVFGGPDV